MTQQQKRGFTWTIAAVLAVASVVWAGGARLQRIEGCADGAGVKSAQALEIAVENRTRAALLEERVDQLEDRVSDLEEIQDMVAEIHEVVCR